MSYDEDRWSVIQLNNERDFILFQTNNCERRTTSVKNDVQMTFGFMVCHFLTCEKEIYQMIAAFRSNNEHAPLPFRTSI